MRRFARWYGAGPLHLLALVASFALTGYAAQRMLSFNPVGVVVWFVGAVVGHDLVLLPLYTLADRPLTSWGRHRERTGPRAPWVNYVRVPAVLSLLLLLVWFPLILGVRSSQFRATTATSTAPYLGRWLLVTGIAFGLSALALAVRVGRATWRRPTSAGP